MKTIVCELCGSNELVKTQGYFVCQHCKTKYSVEEAKKLMIEGTIDVKGTVKIDQSDKLQNLYNLARRTKQAGDARSASQYYKMILLEDPMDWEAIFYTAYYDALNIPPSADYRHGMAICEQALNQTIQQISARVRRGHDRERILREITGSVLQLSQYIVYSSNAYVLSLPEQSRPQFVRNHRVHSTWAVASLLFHYGDRMLVQFSNTQAIHAMAVDVWKAGINLIASDKQAMSFHKKYSSQMFEHYGNKIRAFDTNYVVPTVGYCYIATALYGSYDCPKVQVLRRFRDNVLRKTWYGRRFIQFYYWVSPALVKYFGHTKWFNSYLRNIVDRMIMRLEVT